MIAPCYFQNDDAEEPNRYARRRYLDAAAQVASTCLARLKATPTEEVAVCSGHVLDGVRAWLTAQGYRWHAVRITGALQDQVERAFQLHLAELGFNVGYDLLTDHERAGLFWWRHIQWLKGGDVNALAPIPRRSPSARPAGPPTRRGPTTRTARRAPWRPRPGVTVPSAAPVEHKGHHPGETLMLQHDRSEIPQDVPGALCARPGGRTARGLDAVTREWRRPHTVSGYFDDWEKLAAAAAGIRARGIYVTLHR